VSERPPVHVKPGRPVTPSTKWKHIHGVGLTKSFEFMDSGLRDRFIIQCIALESQRGKQDVVWTIESTVVTVLLKTSPIGLTEPIVEFARTLDDMSRDVGYIASDVQHDYAF